MSEKDRTFEDVLGEYLEDPEFESLYRLARSQHRWSMAFEDPCPCGLPELDNPKCASLGTFLPVGASTADMVKAGSTLCEAIDLLLIGHGAAPEFDYPIAVTVGPNGAVLSITVEVEKP